MQFGVYRTEFVLLKAMRLFGQATCSCSKICLCVFACERVYVRVVVCACVFVLNMTTLVFVSISYSYIYIIHLFPYSSFSILPISLRIILSKLTPYLTVFKSRYLSLSLPPVAPTLHYHHCECILPVTEPLRTPKDLLRVLVCLWTNRGRACQPHFRISISLDRGFLWLFH